MLWFDVECCSWSTARKKGLWHEIVPYNGWFALVAKHIVM
jgi:hypothetical protein